MIPFLAGTQITHWGMKGDNWIVGQYCKRAHTYSDNDDFDNTHFAELWCGTHPKFPAIVHITEDIQKYLTPEFYELNKGKQVSLGDVILANKTKFLGENFPFEIEGKSAGCLPFLFKILSVDSPLSIQAHPDKELAVKLHNEFPDLYPDDNHKPEMLIALSNFEALWRFSTGDKIHKRITSIPALSDFFTDANVGDLLDENKFESTWRELIRILFGSTKEKIKEWVLGTVSHIESLPEDERSRHYKLALHLNNYYPNDVGIIVSFLLNYYELKHGEWLMVGANQPHAWIKGEGIEVQASSDNVIRGGLTPKFKDIKLLNEMLSYETTSEIGFYGEGIDLGYVVDYTYETGFKEMTTKRFHFNSLADVNDEFTNDYYCNYQGILFISKGKGKVIDLADSKEYKVGYLDSFYLLPNRTFRFMADPNEEFEVFISSIAE